MGEPQRLRSYGTLAERTGPYVFLKPELGRTFRERSDENALSFASATTILADTVNFAGGIGGKIRLMTT